MRTINYVTSSSFKKEEANSFLSCALLSSGEAIASHFSFDFRNVTAAEVLEVDLEKLVMAEAMSAYQQIRVPCIVEHAGLIFEDYQAKNYPGGLTKPMWDTLQGDFLEETHSRGRRAIAKAVVGYCDGKSIRTFAGETQGSLSSAPSGSRHFYWDTVFIPDSTDPKIAGKTYAAIVEDESLGLNYKMQNLSQSGKALRKFFDFLYEDAPRGLWIL